MLGILGLNKTNSDEKIQKYFGTLKKIHETVELSVHASLQTN